MNAKYYPCFTKLEFKLFYRIKLIIFRHAQVNTFFFIGNNLLYRLYTIIIDLRISFTHSSKNKLSILNYCPLETKKINVFRIMNSYENNCTYRLKRNTVL